MLKRYYSLILIVFFLASCAHKGGKIQPVSAETSSYKSTTESRKVSAFSQIEAQGQINITLHTGYKQPQVMLQGDPRDLAQVKTVVSGTILFLALGKGFPHHGVVHADVQGQSLNRFSFRGEGLINGSQLHTTGLSLFLANKGTTKLGGSIGLRELVVAGDGLIDISGINSQYMQIQTLSGNPKLQLSGTANVTNLTLAGNTLFSMYWINSDTLTIRAKKTSQIQLAGVVNRLDLELWGHSHFKGRFLRAKRSFAKTHGHSIAEISSVNHQSTLATDASDIYYYNLPTTREDFMAYFGSVLDMREWDQIDMKDFTRYNKQFP